METQRVNKVAGAVATTWDVTKWAKPWPVRFEFTRFNLWAAVIARRVQYVNQFTGMVDVYNNLNRPRKVVTTIYGIIEV